MSPYQILLTTNITTGKKIPDIERLTSLSTRPAVDDYIFIKAEKADYEKAKKLSDDLREKNKENRASILQRIKVYFKIKKYLNIVEELNNYIDIRGPNYRGYVYIRKSIYYTTWSYIRKLEKDLFNINSENHKAEEIRIF